MTTLAPVVIALLSFLILWLLGAPVWFAFTVAILVGALADITAAVRAVVQALKDRPR